MFNSTTLWGAAIVHSLLSEWLPTFTNKNTFPVTGVILNRGILILDMSKTLTLDKRHISHITDYKRTRLPMDTFWNLP